MGLSLPADAPEKLRRFYGLLEERNRVMNLTAIEGEEAAARLHFLDSLALLPLCDFRDADVIDVGTGAGFPGLPIAVAVPSARVTLLDALYKRVDFLREAAQAAGTPCTCLHARAEEASKLPEMREQFDIAVSRAVARLNVLCELCLPFVRVGGIFIAMKAADSAEETAEAKAAAKTLGGGDILVRRYSIPGTDIERCAVVIPKTSPTPEKFPRRFARIQKSPL